MSDDEFDAAGLDPADAQPAEEADPDERELLGDAAGSDDESGDEDEEGEAAADADDAEGAPPRGPAAHPQRPRVDPLLRESNRPRTVRVVPEDERLTSDLLQKSEAAQIIAMRAQQIATRATQFSTGAGLGPGPGGGAGLGPGPGGIAGPGPGGSAGLGLGSAGPGAGADASAALHDPVAIAFQELFERRCPLLLRRDVGTAPDGARLVEEWDPNTMAHTPLTPPVPLGPARPGAAPLLKRGAKHTR